MGMHRVVTTDAEIDAALEEARTRSAEGKGAPRVVSVRYHPGLDVFVLGMSSGDRHIVQRELLEGLGKASKRQLSGVEIIGNGSGLSWPKLDVDVSVVGLVRQIFGSKRWMAEMGRQGGASRSGAKRQAARANGAKGGRPKKKRVVA